MGEDFDDENLEQIFLEGQEALFKISDKKSLNNDSFRGSFGYIYRGEGGSTDQNYYGPPGEESVGGSLEGQKRKSLGGYDGHGSQRDNLMRYMNQAGHNQHKSNDKKYYP